MPFATPNPSGEWHAATSVQASLIFGAGAAIAGEKTWRLSTPPPPATPTPPTVFRSVRRDGWTVAVISLLMEAPFMWVWIDRGIRPPCVMARERRCGPLRRAPATNRRECRLDGRGRWKGARNRAWRRPRGAWPAAICYAAGGGGG